MNNNCYIVIHQGIGDLFNSIGIINYYEQKYNNIFILVLNDLNLNILKEIFFEKKNIIPIIPEFINYEENADQNTCIRCMTYGRPLNYCRDNYSCKYINYSKLNGEIIKIGSFDNCNKWEIYRKNQFSFAHSFYSYNNLDPYLRINNFKLFNDNSKANVIYNKFITNYGEKYILVHEDIDRNLTINKNKIINKNLPIINLNKISEYFVDYLFVIKNAQEIHLIDSSWSVFIYLLSNAEIQNIPIFLNESYFKSFGRDTNIYKNPTYDNWIFY